MRFFGIDRRVIQAMWQHRALRHATVVLLLLLTGLLVLFFRPSSGFPAAFTGISGSSPLPDLARSCSSEQTPFDDVWNLETLQTIFVGGVSTVTEERLSILSTPSKWSCTSSPDTFGPMPALTSLAMSLPGWYDEHTTVTMLGLVKRRIPKPVHFASFSSVLSEYRRAYECRLSELEADIDAAIAANADLGSEDPACEGECPTTIDASAYAVRRTPFLLKLSEEKRRATAALERLALLLRSYEMHAATVRDLTCYSRVSLDLRNELNLLADAVSCMPKIWDAVTSIHDRSDAP